jgi:hypothetical protein
VVAVLNRLKKIQVTLAIVSELWFAARQWQFSFIFRRLLLSDLFERNCDVLSFERNLACYFSPLTRICR